MKGSSLVLSSVGRWTGEENQVMDAAEAAGHPIKAAILLNVSEEEVLERWHEAKELGKRDLTHTLEKRADDADEETFQTRISEFNTKTIPVIRHYQDLGMLVSVPGGADRETVFNSVVDVLYNFALEHPEED